MTPLEGLEAPTVASVQLIRRFPVYDIRRLGFEFEDALRPLVSGGPVVYPPDTGAPDAPKFTLSDGKRIFAASSVGTQLTLDFAGGVPKGGLIAALANACKVLDTTHDNLLGGQERFYHGIVVIFQLKARGNDTVPALRQIARSIVVPALAIEQLSSLDITWGVRDGDFNSSIGLSRFAGYSRAFILQRNANALLHIDGDFDEADEGGVQIAVDVNTKPRLNAPKKGDLSELRERLRVALSDSAPIFVGDALRGLL